MNVAAILGAKGKSVVTAHPNATLEEIAKKLASKRIGAIVVVGAQGRIEGIVSERDIIRSISERGGACLRQPVAECMTRSVKTCDISDTLDELMSKMTAGRFRHLPVVEDGGLVGIVSIGDVVKHHIAAVEMEASALKSYIVAG